jgi:hypothetical protein
VKRALAAVVVLAAVAIGLAARLDERLFGDRAGANGVDAAAPADASGAGSAASNPAATTATPSTAPATTTTTTRLVRVSGAVEVRSGVEGAWRAGVVGEALGVDDAVRAGRNGDATLVMGDGIEVRLSSRSELAVRELSEAAARIRLEEGHLTATVAGGGRRVLRVQARGSDAEAESRGGSFGVVSDGRGQLGVATSTGAVKLTSRGASVAVSAGQSSTAGAGQAPTPPQTVPSSLFLKVATLAATRTNQLTTTVEGATTPGALVRVGGENATADTAGRFALKVPLRDGRNELRVEVVDATGRAQQAALPAVVVDRKKPEIDAAVQWGR